MNMVLNFVLDETYLETVLADETQQLWTFPCC